ncbi:expression site-associated gene (ESAG-like) protein, partial [Trypanosoma theileri]
VAQSLRCHGWCRMLASAILSNVSVETVGYGRRYRHIYRAYWVMQYIEKERLRDSDVVVVYDASDSLLSGASTNLCYHPELAGVLQYPLNFTAFDCSLLYDKAWKLMGYKESSRNPSEPGKSIFVFLN